MPTPILLESSMPRVTAGLIWAPLKGAQKQTAPKKKTASLSGDPREQTILI